MEVQARQYRQGRGFGPPSPQSPPGYAVAPSPMPRQHCPHEGRFRDLPSSPQEEMPYLVSNWSITESCKEETERCTPVTLSDSSWRSKSCSPFLRHLEKPRQSRLPKIIQFIHGKSEIKCKDDLSELPRTGVPTLFIREDVLRPLVDV